MKPSVLLRGSWKALLKNKKRSFLTMLGIVIGIAAVSTIISIGLGFENYMVESLNPEDGDEVTVDIWFEADDFEWSLETNEDIFTVQDRKMIQQIEGVEKVDFPISNMDIAFDEISYGNKTGDETIKLVSEFDTVVLFGRSLDYMDEENMSRVAVLPLTLADEYEDDVENLIGRGIRIVNQNYTIVGIYETSDSEDKGLGSLFQTEGIEVPRATYMHYMGEEQVNNELKIIINDDSLPSEVAEDVIECLEESGSMRQRGKYQHMDLATVDDGLALVLRGITLFIASVAGISLLIAGIGVMNMMYISVSERTKEIGIRRAMGATQKSIRRQFVLEGVLMTSIGGILGYTLGLIFVSIATVFLPFDVGVDFLTISIALGISIVIGLIFSYVPANAAGKKEIITIL